MLRAERAPHPSPTAAPSALRGGGERAAKALITSGADLVYLAEELFLRMFRLTLVLVIAGAALSVVFGHVGGGSSRGQPALTIAFAALAIAFSIAGLLRPRGLYCRLRYSRARQVAPAALGALMTLLNGPDSPSWWLALTLLLLMTTLASTRLSVVAATLTAGAYLLGTLIYGQRVIGVEDAGVLAGTVGLVAYTVVGTYVTEAFGRFVLGLHRLERATASAPARPRRRVANLAEQPPLATDRAQSTRTSTSARPTARPRARTAAAPGRGLTSRQLEAVMLVRDGLKQAEVAISLGVSPRQVERLLTQARERAAAATTSQLVAMLVADGLVPPPEQAIDPEPAA